MATINLHQVFVPQNISSENVSVMRKGNLVISVFITHIAVPEAMENKKFWKELPPPTSLKYFILR